MNNLVQETLLAMCAYFLPLYPNGFQMVCLLKPDFVSAQFLTKYRYTLFHEPFNEM